MKNPKMKPVAILLLLLLVLCSCGKIADLPTSEGSGGEESGAVSTEEAALDYQKAEAAYGIGEPSHCDEGYRYIRVESGSVTDKITGKKMSCYTLMKQKRGTKEDPSPVCADPVCNHKKETCPFYNLHFSYAVKGKKIYYISDLAHYDNSGMLLHEYEFRVYDQGSGSYETVCKQELAMSVRMNGDGLILQKQTENQETLALQTEYYRIADDGGLTLIDPSSLPIPNGSATEILFLQNKLLFSLPASTAGAGTDHENRSLHLFDLDTGKDTLIDEGSISLLLSPTGSDGVLAGSKVAYRKWANSLTIEGIYTVDLQTGERQKVASSFACAFSDSCLFFTGRTSISDADEPKALRIVNLKTGKEESVDLPDIFTYSPSYGDGTVYCDTRANPVTYTDQDGNSYQMTYAEMDLLSKEARFLDNKGQWHRIGA